MNRILVVCTTDSMIWNFLIPHIKELENRGYYVECASSITGDYFSNIKNIHNININEISFRRSPYKISNIRAYRQLSRLIKEKQFDTVFCHEPVGGAIGRLAGHSCGCKVIYMAHGFHFFKGAPKSRIIYYFVEKFLSRFTDVLITINQEDYEASVGFRAKKCIKLNGIGVDTEKFVEDASKTKYLDDELGLPPNAIKILSVGELIERKNHEVVIKAIYKLNNPLIFYFIVGEGEQRKKLEYLITKLHLEKQVFLLGYRTDINSLCNSADIFAMPSVHEGLSVALMEAMGCGKAVVCSRIRGNIDLIEENKGGYLCLTYDVDEYVSAIEQLAFAEEKRYQFGEFNKKCIKDFDISLIKNQLIYILTNS